MHAFVAAGAGFLLAVLWFDLMFDVQTRKHVGNPLPPEVLASIPMPRDVYGSARRNSRGLDLSNEDRLVELDAALAASRATSWTAAPMLAQALGAGPDPSSGAASAGRTNASSR